MLNDTPARSSIERSRPHYRRALLVSALVFTGLLCANLALFGHLVFRDLGDRMRKEAIAGAKLRAVQLAQKLSDEGQIDLYKIHQRITTFSEYVREVLTRERYVKEFTLYDAQDRAVTSWTRKGGTIFNSGLGFHQLNRGRRPDLPEPDDPGAAGSPDIDQPTLKIDTHERDKYYAWIPIPGTPRRGMVEVGIDEHQLGREIDELRQALMIKIAIGAGISVLLLLVAFTYVIRLLARTRRLEAEAQMADRMAYVGTLASGLAHEIRNPLNAMNMNLQMLEEEMADRHPDPESASLLSSTKGEVRRLEGLVNDFLSYARPTEPRLEPRDLNALVEEIVRFLRAELQQKEIAIEVVLPPSLPLVPIDEAQLRQAVMNILINAMEVLRPGGKIEIATGVASPSDVFLRITDDGPGIPEEIRRRIFEVFFSTRGGGTGLGLPIAQKIVAAHGGRIEMTTQLGKGTTFVLHLPRAPRAEPRPATAAVHAR